MKKNFFFFLFYTLPLLSELKVIAHRGASFEAPENTLAAFSKAEELGASLVLQKTKYLL